MKQLLRKSSKALIVFAACFSMLLMAGCVKDKKASKDKRTKIQVMVGFGTGTDPSQVAVHEALAKEFNDTIGKEKNITLEFVTVQYADSEQKFTTLVAGGMTPDICGPVGVMGVGKFIDEWMDIEPYLQKDGIDLNAYDEALVDSMRYSINGENKLVGLPIGYYPSALYYNEDIFDRAGIDYPPTTWGTKDWTYEKMIDQARRMTLDKDGNDTYSADFDMEGVTQFGYDGTDWAPFRAWVGKYFDKNGNSVALGISDDMKTAQMNSPEWKKAFKDLRDQVFVYKVRPSSDSNAGAALFGDNDPLGSNKCAMWEIFSWMSYAYEGWDANFNWNIAPIPSFNGHIVSATNIDTFVMCKSAKNHDQAWEVYKWLFQPENYIRLNKNYGGIPAMKQFQKSWIEERKNGVVDENGEVIEEGRPNINWQVLIDAGAYADNPNNEAWVPNFGKVWDAMETAMANVISGFEEDTDKVAEDLNAEVQTYLDEYWENQK